MNDTKHGLSAKRTDLHQVGICLVAVHAHPDDETLATGLALAHHALAGSSVHVITATLGEEGEVIPAELAHLEGSEDLGPYRHTELMAAMGTLGVQHSYLGATHDSATATPMPRWRDSGMVGSAAASHARAFAGADLGEAATVLAAELRDIRPDVLLTYDPQGGYRHPDHIQTHVVVVAALAELAPAQRPRMYVACTPRSWAEEDRAWVRRHVPASAGLAVLGDDAPYPPSVGADDQVTDRLIDTAAAELRTRALRHHRTQVSVFDGYFALSNDVAARLSDREGYREWTIKE
ncbi:MAG: PIG-L family deacetylase [Ornithinimicrobium sp.]